MADKQYVRLFTRRPVERFLWEFSTTPYRPESLIIVSPIIGALRGVRVNLSQVVQRITQDRINTFVITREPQDKYHRQAVDLLKQSPWVEVRYNPSLHAKLYVCRERERGFALLGSGNLTSTSVLRNIEVAVMIYTRGPGKDLVHELFRWGSERLRTQSRLVKPLQPRR